MRVLQPSETCMPIVCPRKNGTSCGCGSASTSLSLVHRLLPSHTQATLKPPSHTQATLKPPSPHGHTCYIPGWDWQALNLCARPAHLSILVPQSRLRDRALLLSLRRTSGLAKSFPYLVPATKDPCSTSFSRIEARTRTCQLRYDGAFRVS